MSAEPFRLLPGPGTHAWESNPDPARPRNWWRRGSALHGFLTVRGIDYMHAEDPFIWSTKVDGVFGENEIWAAEGKSLRWYATAKGYARLPAIWAHSHFAQLVAHAAAEWHLPIFVDRLVTFGSPLREDVPWREALPRIGRWLIVTDDFDLVQMLGGFGDHARGNPEFPDRVTVKVIPGVDHSRLLQDPSYFSKLETEGILAFTLGAESATL